MNWIALVKAIGVMLAILFVLFCAGLIAVFLGPWIIGGLYLGILIAVCTAFIYAEFDK